MKALETATGKEFFAQIVAEPDDDAPRLVLADWLQERGDPFGEFIALQVKKPNHKRIKTLRLDHYSDWMGPLIDVVDPFSVKFVRGFIDSMSLTSDYWPDARTLRLIKAAVGAPQLALVTRLVLERGVGGGGLHNERGSMMEAPRGRGKQIPIVAFLLHPVLRHLTEVSGSFGPEVRAALTGKVRWSVPD
ncbi:MAG: TIGR02996 domain-containing protein [Myxococcales bacterium]|nr:TIGR02996 domain-containing protein [Myxococcales bacterium]